MASAVPPPRIAIVGAGPAGLTLAALLHSHAIPSTVFELRPQPSEAEYDEPAGSLDLHEGTGLAAVRALGLYEAFSALTDDCSEDMLVADKSGAVIYHHVGDVEGGEPRPEIARNKLNQLLLTKVPAGSVRWRHKLLSAEIVPSSTVGISSSEVELDFGDGNNGNDAEEEREEEKKGKGKYRFDLVVGADGAWSRVRPLLTPAKPRYAGQHNVTATIRGITARHPRLARLVGEGSFMCCGDRHGVVSQRAARDSARVYAMISAPDENFAREVGLKGRTPAECEGLLFDGADAPLRGFGAVIRELLGAALRDETDAKPGAEVDVRPLHTLYGGSDDDGEGGRDEGARWEHKAGATLIGDAAHLMPPNGEGVNMGMRDALEVCKAIVQARDRAAAAASTAADGGGADVGSVLAEELDKGMAAYEADMYARADEVARETAQLLGTLYGSDDGAEAMVEMMKGFEKAAAEAAAAAAAKE
ncbi:hypothetical protein N3K66_006444 [Trichothecium roseum]|uniref:Uncharacterized protein n=1 Tax=Trichothecium roseum TaxID=47278 RepID=A0ACC0UVF1_9HYPO|nr:hypothetical protein N3K66_006444 [Trichothecium roseum]